MPASQAESTPGFMLTPASQAESTPGFMLTPASQAKNSLRDESIGVEGVRHLP